jgi:hypothetical protein
MLLETLDGGQAAPNLRIRLAQYSGIPWANTQAKGKSRPSLY